MILLLGSFFIAAGIVWLLNFYLYKRAPLKLSKFITALVGFILIFTGTVHGIWLGLTVILLGFFWLSILSRKRGMENGQAG